MKKLLLLCFLSLFLFLNSNATHSLGGYITYKHLSNFNYEVTVIIYADPNSPANGRKETLISWGDGKKDSIKIVSEVLVENDLLKRTFKKNHTYPGGGNYIISLEEPNRNVNIDNIPNSINIPLYLETKLTISPIAAIKNNSISIEADPIAIAKIGEDFKQNLAVAEPDEDILIFELVETKGANGTTVPGYFLPDSISINRKSGEFLWKSPQQFGLFVFTIKVTECRDGNLIGSNLIDFQVRVRSLPTKSRFLETSKLPADTNNNYEVFLNSNDSLELSIAFFDSLLNPLELNAFSDAFDEMNKPSFMEDSLNTGYIRKTFKWNTNSSNLRCKPYLFTFRGNSTINFEKVEKDLSLVVYVRDQSLLNCDSACSDFINSVENKIKHGAMEVVIYPNPFQESTTVKMLNSSVANGSFKLFDNYGRKVYSIELKNKSQISLDRNNLSSGIYFYTIESEQNYLKSGKLIVTD